jgi:transitional endoplasmic reticulum ATPase
MPIPLFEPDRTHRICELTLAQRLSGQVAGLLLVLDEAEDIFVGVDDGMGANRRGAKVFLNNLVERNAAPVIWISNHPALLGPAVLRRMTYAVAFPQLDRKARERVVRRSASRNKMQIGEDGIRTLAALDAPPALIDSGLRVARLCNASTEFAVRAAKSVLDVIQGRSAMPEQRQTEFHTAFARADTNLEHLTERIVASRRTDISLCLSGMPGTGKSAYARFLAKRMGIDVMDKRAIDLLGMFVGETEQNIAACFREAERRCAFLIFDEADLLLRNRASADRSHEVQQVNEMLTWMERHPYPFACTTNFADGLDPAAARRFLFKVTFLLLAPRRLALSFVTASASTRRRGSMRSTL